MNEYQLVAHKFWCARVKEVTKKVVCVLYIAWESRGISHTQQTEVCQCSPFVFVGIFRQVFFMKIGWVVNAYHITLQDKKQPECSPAHIQFHVLWREIMGENYIQISIFNMELLLFFSGTLFINHRSTGNKINIAKRNGCISIKSCIFHFRSLCQRGNHTICVISYRFFSGKLQFICK